MIRNSWNKSENVKELCTYYLYIEVYIKDIYLEWRRGIRGEAGNLETEIRLLAKGMIPGLEAENRAGHWSVVDGQDRTWAFCLHFVRFTGFLKQDGTICSGKMQRAK